MERYLQIACCLYFLSFDATAFPVFNSQTSPYTDVNNLCNELAVSRLLDDGSYPALSDFLSSMRSDNERNNLDNQSNGFSDNRFDIRNIFMDEKGIQDIAVKIMDLRKACLTIYASANVRPTTHMKKDPENFQILDSENFSDGGLKELLGRSTLNESPKRNSDLSLNPTGWRKRRSSRNDDETESMRHFLQNMREILEKRERLQFNPTGW